MPKLSPRDAVRLYRVSRATLTKALSDGKISAEKTDAGHWQIDPAELARVYAPRAPQKAVSRDSPGQVSRDEPGQKTALDAADMAARLARAEAARDAERAKVDLLQRNLDDLRRMLPPPDAKPRRWWPW
jgi:multidrug efflux pump subunit AcrA (membrane-fusion protein)